MKTHVSIDDATNTGFSIMKFWIMRTFFFFYSLCCTSVRMSGKSNGNIYTYTYIKAEKRESTLYQK